MAHAYLRDNFGLVRVTKSLPLFAPLLGAILLFSVRMTVFQRVLQHTKPLGTGRQGRRPGVWLAAKRERASDIMFFEHVYQGRLSGKLTSDILPNTRAL
jgi:hypothetical protein